MNRVLTFFVVIILAGCSTYSAPRYASTADSLIALKSYKGKKVNVSKFSSSNPGRDILCRGVAPIQTPDGVTFAGFIRNAFTNDLKLAEIYSPSAPTTITGHLNKIDFDSVAGIWDISLTVKSPNGTVLTVIEKYHFSSSFNGDVACGQTAQALTPAVQNLISKLTQSPRFASLLD